MLILFIDDDYEDYEMFCEATHMINPGIECIFKFNGATGLAYLQQATRLPDCIFLDINMPIMDGFETLKKIRMDDKLKEIPVVIFSTAIDAPNIHAYTSLGAIEFISKPSSYPALVRLLRDVLNRLPFGGLKAPSVGE